MVSHCKTCVFFDPIPEKENMGNDTSLPLGLCRKHAPAYPAVRALGKPPGYILIGSWPAVHENDWCGEGGLRSP